MTHKSHISHTPAPNPVGANKRNAHPQVLESNKSKVIRADSFTRVDAATDAPVHKDTFEASARCEMHRSNSVQLALGDHILSNNTKGIQDCISRGAQLNLPAHTCGMLPLSLALMDTTRRESAEILVKLDPTCVNMESDDSFSPLAMVTATGNVPMVGFLLSHGANPFVSAVNGRLSSFDQLAQRGPNDLSANGKTILSILQDWRCKHPSMFQTSLRLAYIRK